MTLQAAYFFRSELSHVFFTRKQTGLKQVNLRLPRNCFQKKAPPLTGEALISWKINPKESHEVHPHERSQAPEKVGKERREQNKKNCSGDSHSSFCGDFMACFLPVRSEKLPVFLPGNIASPSARLPIVERLLGQTNNTLKLSDWVIE